METLAVKIREGVEYENTLKANYDISLRSLRVLRPDQIVFGPTYETYTSSGIYVRFDTYIDKYSDSSKIVLFGFNEDNTLIAYRHSVYQDKGSYLVAHGYVAAAIKGQGVGTATELVHEDMLYRIARRTGKKAVYETTNANQRALAEAILEYRSFISNQGIPLSEEGKKKFAEIKRCEEEQNRWHSIFGVSGKFGYQPCCSKYDTYKVFDPNGGPEDHIPLEQIDFIELERLIVTCPNGRLLYIPRVIDLQQGREDELRDQKYAALINYPFLTQE